VVLLDGLLSEVSIIDIGGDSGKRNLSGGRKGVSLVDSLERDTVDLVRSGNEEQTRGQLLKEHDSSASELAGEKNQDGTRGDISSEFGRSFLGKLSSGEGDSLVVSLVPLGDLGNSLVLTLRTLSHFS